MADQEIIALDLEVRRYIYDQAINTGRPPTAAQTTRTLSRPPDEVIASYRRLADGHIIVLHPQSGEILMANPFSAVPTPFVVDAGGRTYWGNCIWDALGIAAMLGQDARVSTACPDCGDPMLLEVEGGKLSEIPSVAHFSLPARRWWDDIVYT